MQHNLSQFIVVRQEEGGATHVLLALAPWFLFIFSGRGPPGSRKDFRSGYGHFPFQKDAPVPSYCPPTTNALCTILEIRLCLRIGALGPRCRSSSEIYSESFLASKRSWIILSSSMIRLSLLLALLDSISTDRPLSKKDSSVVREDEVPLQLHSSLRRHSRGRSTSTSSCASGSGVPAKSRRRKFSSMWSSEA